MAKRHDQRDPSQLREVAVTLDYTEMALASCLIEVGKTRVLCSVSAEDRVPPLASRQGIRMGDCRVCHAARGDPRTNST